LTFGTGDLINKVERRNDMAKAPCPKWTARVKVRSPKGKSWTQKIREIETTTTEAAEVRALAIMRRHYPRCEFEVVGIAPFEKKRSDGLTKKMVKSLAKRRKYDAAARSAAARKAVATRKRREAERLAAAGATA
jgi:hypothetical protein